MSVESDIAAVTRISAVPAILSVVSQMTGLRLTLVARVTSDSWTACATLDRLGFGLNAGDQLDVATTLCSEVRDRHRPIVIEHASMEPEYCGHPTPKMYGFESYVSFPIFRTNGEFFGTLCGLDSSSMLLRNEKTINMLTLFAELISLQLAAEEHHERDLSALSEERISADLREKFIAALGHDLRTPLTSVIAGADLLLIRETAQANREIVEQIRASGKRMARLVDDLADFTRGRFGDGIQINADSVDSVDEIVQQVVAEIAMVEPRRAVKLQTSAGGPARLDRSRVSQLMSNLVMNAIQHGDRSERVDVVVEGDDQVIRFSVTNQGAPIPPESANFLFHPFYRGAGSAHQSNGLGLGLFIASQIAKAHGGSITFSSSAGEGTKFMVTFPRFAPA